MYVTREPTHYIGETGHVKIKFTELFEPSLKTNQQNTIDLIFLV